MERFLMATLWGVVFGLLSRYTLLRSDYRRYPGYPHGFVSHLALGLIAAILGALAIPALMEKELPALAFLSLAATQFRDIREIERKTLAQLDNSSLVPRGPDYIEGIARVFEARNYLVMLTALLVSGVAYFTSALFSLPVGLIALLLNNRLMRGKTIGEIATVRTGEVRFEGPNLFVESIHFANIAPEKSRRKIIERGLGVVIEPFNDDARAILSNHGQRMAIAHDAALQLGVYKDVDTAEFTPLLRSDLETGRLAMIIMPIEPDVECLLLAVNRAPVLESAVSRPLSSRAGRGAAD